MRCSRQNPMVKYYMEQTKGENREIQVTELEDLIIYVSNTSKASFNCARVANKAMGALRLLRISFDRLTIENFKPLFYIRPHLGLGTLLTSNWAIHEEGPTMMEKVQRRATKLVQGLRDKPHEERLRTLQLISIEERFRHGDIMETYKMLTGKTNVDPNQLFVKEQGHMTRGHCLKLKVKRVKTKMRAKFFSNREVPLWNSLPSEVVEAETLQELEPAR